MEADEKVVDVDRADGAGMHRSGLESESPPRTWVQNQGKSANPFEAARAAEREAPGRDLGALQRESRVAGSQGRTCAGRRRLVRANAGLRQRRERRPERRNGRRHCDIGKVEYRRQFDDGLTLVVADLLAGLAARAYACIVVRRIDSDMSRRNDDGTVGGRRNLRLYMRMRAALLQQAGIRPTRPEREQPHCQHRECGAAPALPAREEVHLNIGNVRRSLGRHRGRALICINPALGRGTESRLSCDP